MPVKSCTEQPLLSGFFEKKYYSQFCRTSVRTARDAAVLIPVGWKCVRAVTYPISFSLATNSSIAHIPATPQGYAALRALTPQFSETKKVLSKQTVPVGPTEFLAVIIKFIGVSVLES